MVWLREYSIPLAFALMLHFVLLFWLASDFTGKTRQFELKEPKFVKANLVKLKPQTKEIPIKPPQQPKIEPVNPEQKKATPPEIKKPAAKKPDPKIEQQKKAAETAKRLQLEKATLEKARLEKEKIAKEKAKKERLEKEQLQQKKLQEQQKRQKDILSKMEDEELVEDAQQDEVTAQSYISFIQRAIESNWNRPPSARNGMQVLLNIQLIPTGDVVHVSVAKSSGNEAFDRSAISAVEKAGSFSELAELEPRIFEKYYRRFTLLFKPEDLRL